MFSIGQSPAEPVSTLQHFKCTSNATGGTLTQCAGQHDNVTATDLGLLLGLNLIPIHLLLQVTLGVLIDLDEIYLLVSGMLSLSLELVEQVSLTDEVICLLALAIHSTLQAVNFTLQI